MKKSCLLVLIFFFLTITLHAQVTQGRFTAGDHPRNDILRIQGNQNTRSVSFSPSVGYFLTNNVLLGAQFSAFNVNENNNVDFSQWSFSPFARYYLPGNFFLTAGLGIGNQRRNISGFGVQDRITFYDVSVGAGKDFFLRGDVALEGVLVYQYANFSGEFLVEDESVNTLLLDFNLQPFLGAGLDVEVSNPLGAGSVLLDLPAQLQWQGQTANDGFFTINLAPKFGYFIDEHFVVGGQVIASVFGTEQETLFGFGLSPLVRYYFPPLADKLYAFGGLTVGFEKEPGADDAFWSGEFGPGLDYFLSTNVALEGQLAYTFLKFKDVPALERALIRVGVQVFLRK